MRFGIHHRGPRWRHWDRQCPCRRQARKASEALTIAVVSYPFVSEGAVRRQNAEWGLERLREVCDTVIVLPNERLLEVEE